MEDLKEMDEITKAITKMAIEATPERRRSKRVRHLKAVKIVQSKNKENISNNNNNQSKRKRGLKPISETKEETKKNETIPIPNIDLHKTDAIFPPYNSNLKYEKLSKAFEIETPKYISEWLHTLLAMIVESDLSKEVSAYSWIVLLHPSLILIQSRTHLGHTSLTKLVCKVLQKFADFMYFEATKHGNHISELSLNDLLICIELFALDANERNEKKLKLLHSHINTIMEPTNTFNKFLKLSCARSKDIKAVSLLLECECADLNKKALFAQIRKKWESFIGVYTQMTRLHRIYTKSAFRLSDLCKDNLEFIFETFNDKYCNVLRDLLLGLQCKSEKCKMDYSYIRYKTLAMATHTPTTIVPTFAGYYGYINNSDIDTVLWKGMIDALIVDVNKFVNCVNYILLAAKHRKNKNKNVLKIIEKMTQKEKHSLRTLDNICYQSVCAMIISQSLSECECECDTEIGVYFNKLKNVRKKMCTILEKLSANNLLFCKEMNNGLNSDVLHSCFLTYEKEQKQVWSVHLMSGVLLNYWTQKK